MMKTIIALAFVVIASSVSAGKIEGKFKGMMHNITCKGESFLDSKAMWNGHKECFQKMYTPMTSTPSSAMSEEAKKEMFKKLKEIKENVCLDVCVMKTQNIINEDNTYNSDAADKFIKSVIPVSAQSDMKKAFDSCATENSKSFSMDNNCAGYKAFRECKQKKFMEICEIKPHMHHPHGSLDQTTESH